MKDHNKGTEYSKALTKPHKKEILYNLLGDITYKRHTQGVASVLAEISFLSTENRSCLVTIDNQTSTDIVYHKCFIVRGRQSSYAQFDHSIPPNENGSFSFEKHTALSMEGCAALIFFSINALKDEGILSISQSNRRYSKLCKPGMEYFWQSHCFFVVAFRNYTIQKLKPNKAVLAILDGPASMDDLSSLPQFGKLMNNDKPKPSFQGCYTGSECQQTFMFSSPGCRLRNMLEFKSTTFTIKIDGDNHHSVVSVTIA